MIYSAGKDKSILFQMGVLVSFSYFKEAHLVLFSYYIVTYFFVKTKTKQ